MKDYYSILGVTQTSGPTEIKRIYRKLAIQYHPDKNPDPQAEQLFKEISEAYDVLSDPQKKSLYDQRRENPFAEIFEEAPRPMHRDPAYKRPRARQPRVKAKTQLQEAMEHYLKYVLWFSKVGLLLTSVFFVDYLLPAKIREEKIGDIQGVRLRRGYAYFNLRTESGKKIKIYPTSDLGFFEKRATITASYTLIFGTPLSITNSSGIKIDLGYFYRFQFFLPLLLFLASLFSYVFRNRIEFSFNMGVVSALLLILNYIFY